MANGDYQQVFQDIVNHHQFHKRVAICDFSEQMEHLAYAASDFILMPSRFEPCGLPQMIAPIYGSLPVAHDTGGIHDTVQHLDVAADTGNGFRLQDLRRQRPVLGHRGGDDVLHAAGPGEGPADQAHHDAKAPRRSPTRSTARQYIDLYEKMLQRPLVVE